MRIDRCVCFNLSFAELARIAEATGARSLEALQAEARFGEGCRRCHPYVRRLLRTGETCFFELLSEEEAADV